jgi:hypothetical protein
VGPPFSRQNRLRRGSYRKQRQNRLAASYAVANLYLGTDIAIQQNIHARAELDQSNALTPRNSVADLAGKDNPPRD